jgi:hypothetical protein
MKMTKEVKGSVFKSKDGEVYETYAINRQEGLVNGYLLFPAFGQSNPCRTFKIDECVFKELRK